jgi:hypothetical protein
MYDSLANFVLIGNLKTLTFHFTDASYSISRTDLQTWYGTDLPKLLNENSCTEIVNEKLADKDSANRFFTQVVKG